MILLIGHLGKAGKRYAKILDSMSVKWYGIDLLKQPWDYDQIKKCKKALICTPTETHFSWCSTLKIDWLCEKPLSKDIKEVEKLIELTKLNGVTGLMVNNWELAICIALQQYSGRGGDCVSLGDIDLTYNSPKSGDDGEAWDCIQLIHLCGDRLKISVHPDLKFDCYIQRKYMKCEITRETIQESYKQMLKRWLEIPNDWGECGWGRGGWDLSEALTAHKEVIEWKKSQF